jgi:hypothetical protein
MIHACGPRRDGNSWHVVVSGAAFLVLGPEDGPGGLEALPAGRLTRGTLRPTNPKFHQLRVRRAPYE